jgi:hypothetical protein
MAKWNQSGEGNVHVSDGQEGFWASFPKTITAKKALAEYMRTADYSEATRAFNVRATVLSGKNKGDQATTTYRP